MIDRCQMHNSKLVTLLNAIKHLILLNAYMIIYVHSMCNYIFVLYGSRTGRGKYDTLRV